MHLALLVAICATYVFVKMIQKNHSKNRATEATLMGICLFIFAALRAPSVGIDVPSYCSEYIVYSRLTLLEAFHSGYRDIAWPVFSKLLSFLSSDPQILLIVVGAWLAFAFSYFAYHMKGDLLLTYILFICLRIFPFTLTGLRQTVAMGFIFIATVLITKGHYKKAIIFTLCAAPFHASSLAFLLAFLLIFIKSDRLVLGGALAVVGVNLVSGNRLVAAVASLIANGRFERYAETALNQGFSFGSTFLIVVAFFIFVSFYLPRLKKEDTSVSLVYRFACLGMTFFAVGQGFANMFRISYYFVCCLFPLFSCAEYKAIKNDQVPYLNLFLILLLCGQYLIIGPGAGIDHYMFFWQ